MSLLYAAIAKTKRVGLALLKVQRAVLNTVMHFCLPFTKLQSRYRLIVNYYLWLINLQSYTSFNSIYSLLT